MVTINLATGSIHPFPSFFRFLPVAKPGTIEELRNKIVLRAGCDLLICEDPPSSNRSLVIDEMCRRAGAPLGSYWCMCAAMEWWEDAGAVVPPLSLGIRPGVLPVYEWYRAHHPTTLHTTPTWGDLIIYEWRTASGGLDHHTGIVARTKPLVRSIEGNTSIDGTLVRDGEGVEPKTVKTARVKAYISPMLVTV